MGREQSTWSYGYLDARARTIAAHLRTVNATAERVLLFYPPGLEFVAGFWGCLYAGAIPVPLYPLKSKYMHSLPPLAGFILRGASYR